MRKLGIINKVDETMTPQIHVVCGGAIVKDDKILLIKNARGDYKSLGWCIPGGKLKENETIEECVIREMFEETNLKCEIIEFISVFDDFVQKGNERRHYLLLNFLLKPKHGIPEPKDDALELRWFSKEDLKDLKMSNATKKTLSHLGWI